MAAMSVLPARKGVLSPQSQAGYEPEALDSALEKHIKAAEAAIFNVSSLEKQVKTALENMNQSQTTGDGLQEADRVSVIYERLAKATLSLVKCTDELTRLRSFLAGGPDSRPDLSSKGELDLQKELLAVIQDLGWQVTLPSQGQLEVV